ncbi:helicase HerA domain-containing protein [Thermoplasma sp.]|uniref:helicase HerA domain-containing protein n=1 Tax=Thermoplasma sp. TaxID=1973142 RepID=UPI001278FF97|nr:DUF87 domain-containing protein [Thermoplasma sp.]KAA8923482.1 MAG: ATP-binding protein [Thermoplasma sp.]
MNRNQRTVLRNVLAYRPEYYGIPMTTLLALIASGSSFLILIRLFGPYAVIAVPIYIIIIRAKTRNTIVAWVHGILPVRVARPKIVRSGDRTIIDVQGTTAVVARLNTAYDNHPESFSAISSFITGILDSGFNVTAYSIPHAADRADVLPNLSGKVYYTTYLLLWHQEKKDKNLIGSTGNLLMGDDRSGLTFSIGDDDIELIGSLFPGKKMNPRNNYISGERNISIFSLVDSEKDIFPSYCEALEISDINTAIKFSARRMEKKALVRTAAAKIADLTFELGQRSSRKENTEYLRSVMRSAEILSNESRKENPDVFTCGLDFLVMNNTPYGLTREISKLDRGLKIAGMKVKNVSFRAGRSVQNFFDLSKENIPYPMDLPSIGSFFPAYFSTEESAGIFLGINEYTGKPIYLDYFSHTSYNFIVTGETGSGKSYFAKIFSRRVYRERYSKLMILDPLNEYHCADYGDACIEIDLYVFNETAIREDTDMRSPDVLIVKYDLVQAEKDARYGIAIAEAISKFMSRVDGRKTILLDEANMVLRNDDALRIVENTVRHSRHFETSVFIITQSISDIKLGMTIEENSVHRFFFRSAMSADEIRRYIPEEDDVRKLAGGKNRNFSECYYAYGDKYMKLLITGEDDS